MPHSRTSRTDKVHIDLGPEEKRLGDLGGSVQPYPYVEYEGSLASMRNM